MTGMGRGRREADTCREVILPALHAAGWSTEQIVAEYPIRAERTLRLGTTTRDLGDGRVDYVLEIVPGLPVAVIEAKREYRDASDGLGQALRYGEQLGVPISYASNGENTIEHDFHTGREREHASFRSPAELWSDYCDFLGLEPDAATLLTQPLNRKKRTASGDVASLRWYQQVAVNRVLTGIARGDRRLLLLMATGTGKTFTAMQIVHKLRAYNQQVNSMGNYRVLYLADRDALVDQPMTKDFGTAFPSESMARVGGGVDGKSRDIVFSTYQSLTAGTDTLSQYAPDFFHLVIVDECHRGSADEQSRFHEVLAHFAPAVQLGLTATPKRDETIDTYRYFGEPVFQYTLRQGIQDGYLAPYHLRRAVLDVDAEGWEPEPGQVDDSGFLLEPGVYTTRDFERTLVLMRRTERAARYLMERLRRDRGRMIIFCHDIEHATRMRKAMIDLAPDWTREDPQWVVRITAADDDKQRLVKAMSDPDTNSPLVATTSRLLATGVDVEDLKYVVIFRPVGSQIEFKQIVGRGTRLFPEKGKTHFEIIDFVGAAQHFEDPEFDGFPAVVTTDVVDADGGVESSESEEPQNVEPIDDGDPSVEEAEPNFTVENPDDTEDGDVPGGPRPVDSGEMPSPGRVRFVVSDAEVNVLSESLFVPDTSTNRLRLTEFGIYVGDTVRSFAGSASLFGQMWASKPQRDDVVAELEARGIDRAALLGADDASVDPFDVLVKLAWNLPARTRAERARLARENHFAELEAMGETARAVITALLDRYADSGIDDAVSAEALNLPPLTQLGPRRTVLRALGPHGWSDAQETVQRWLYTLEVDPQETAS